MIDRGGVVIVTFTAISENFSAVVNEYERGSRTVLEVDAELLPIKRPISMSAGNPANGNGQQPPSATSDQMEIVGFEKVPRLKVAGPGTDGNLRANIVYYHIEDNKFFGWDAALRRYKAGATTEPLFGKERFLRAYRDASRERILARVYGVLTATSAQQFPKFSDAVHVVEPDTIPRVGTNFHIVDPCDARPWAMIWIRIDPAGRFWIYREWPSTGHTDPSAYIQGKGDPGPWTTPGQPADGVRGPAQEPLGFGLDRYVREIRRLEGRSEEEPEARQEEPEDERSDWWTPVSGVRQNRLPRRPRRPGVIEEELEGPGEPIEERWMDSRYAASPTRTKEGSTTLIEQMAEAGMEFKAASGKEILEGIALVNDLLDYDAELPLGEFSPRLGRLNAPKLYISRNCPNLIYALREYTGRDGTRGTCKDWIDLARYAALAELTYVGGDAYVWM
jgi:hypothetical protein